MEQRLSIVTLGVSNMDRAAGFYESMGWKRVKSPDGVIAFDLIGMTLGLYSKDKLLQDIGIVDKSTGAGGFSGVTLAYNVREKKEVSPVLEKARAAGGRIVKEAQDVFWGGHHGYFADLDGNLWEVAHNPFSKLREDGAFCWNGYPDVTDSEKAEKSSL